MIETADSIKKYGVLVPAIARPLPDGGYELVAGHRRRRASELAGKETMPVIVRDLDDDAATIIMVDSNLQRENLLPSERAFAYKMKLEAIKHQGARTDLTSVQVEQKLSARDQVAKEAGERSGIQVMRYSKKFREEHEEEILLHQAAKNAFDEMCVKKLPKVKELQTEYAKLLEEKKKTYAEYRRSREEMRELLTAKANVDRVLKMEVEQDVEKEKDHGQR
jgi:ParB-like chromosome segregation protein Spo0J